MTITIKRAGSKYEAELTPSDGREPWSTSQPMCQRELIDALLARGCHQRDIGDAFYDADPEWLMRE